MKKILLIALTLMFSFNLKAGAFDDVPVDHWAYDAVEYLAAKGYVIGYPDEEFKGDQQMTRYEWAVMLARLERDLNMRFSAEGGGTPDDVSGLMAMLRSEFDAELAEVRAAIAANELRIDALSGEVMDLWEEIDNLDDRMSRIGPGGGPGFAFTYGFEWNEQQGISAMPGGPAPMPGNNEENLWGHMRMDMAHESGDFMFGMSLQTEMDDAAQGEKNMFMRQGPWVPLTSNDFSQQGNGDARNWIFDLHETYMVYNGKSSANGLDYVVGKFEPFWTQSSFSWNPYETFEGFVIGGELKQYRFVTGWMDDSDNNAGGEVTFLQATSDSLVFGLPGTFGWTENGGGKIGSLSSTLNLISKDLKVTYLWDAGAQSSSDSSYEIKTNINLLEGWNGSLAWRKTGTSSNVFGQFYDNVDYISLGVSRNAADNVKMSWMFDWGNTTSNDNSWQLSWNVKGSF